MSQDPGILLTKLSILERDFEALKKMVGEEKSRIEGNIKGLEIDLKKLYEKIERMSLSLVTVKNLPSDLAATTTLIRDHIHSGLRAEIDQGKATKKLIFSAIIPIILMVILSLLSWGVQAWIKNGGK